jgi:hypothetical protein
MSHSEEVSVIIIVIVHQRVLVHISSSTIDGDFSQLAASVDALSIVGQSPSFV